MGRFGLLAVALSLCFVANADGDKARPATDPEARAKVLYRDIVDSDLSRHSPQANHLIECGEAALPYLTRLLRSGERDRISIGLSGMATLKPQGMAHEVAKLIAREDVRTEAIKTLGTMRDRAAVHVLRVALADESYNEWRRTIVGSLAILGDNSVTDELLRMAEYGIYVFCDFGLPIPVDTRSDGWIAHEAISQFEPEQRRQWLQAMLDSGIAGRQDVAASIAHRAGEARWNDQILKIAKERPNLDLTLLEFLLDLGDTRVEEVILEFVGNTTSAKFARYFSILAGCRSDAATSAVRIWLERQNEWLKVSAVALASNDIAIVEDWCIRIQNSNEDEFSGLTGMILRQEAYKNPRYLDAFMDRLAEDRRQSRLEALGSTLAFFELNDSLDQFLELADSDWPDERFALASGLGRCTTANSLGTLLRLSSDSDSRVRVAAKESLLIHGVVFRAY